MPRSAQGPAIEQQTARDGGDIVLDTDRTSADAAHPLDVARHVIALGPDHEFEIGLAALIRGLDPATPGYSRRSGS